QHLECATFHILTPYPGTPMFEQLEREGRILTREWDRYDTAHVVFQPARMTPTQLEEGYRRAYRELYAWPTVAARRPPGLVRAGAYLAMTALYKKWDLLWRALVPMRLTHAVWNPLVELHWRMGRSARARFATPPGELRSDGEDRVSLPLVA
ncbi:MAG TPA: DUF4070 domain-containing protein, partial [Polyangiaceae bacterium]|nr:DUF4070 domain-containing protein [Polyangiaceae bacterium]